MHVVDWVIVFGMLAFLIAVVIGANRLSRGVADFLAAGRCGGRYIICVSEGIAAVCAITFIGLFEMHYQAGFSAVWWNMMMAPIMAAISLSGWIIYRYRETRVLTLGQFFEIRYSKRFRIFAGILCFFSGVVNFGIFPAVGARFFCFFCQLPPTFPVFGIAVSTYAVVMLILLIIALYFTFAGGQVAVILTDFFQGVFCNIMFLVILIALLLTFPWSQVVEGLMAAPKDASLLHPFHTSDAKDFNIWYFLIGAIGTFYTYFSWQGSQGYNASARTPHEARMGKILGTWRVLVMNVLIVMIPVCAYTMLHHPAFSGIASLINQDVSAIENTQIQKQMLVPIALSHFLPMGLAGAFCAVMLAAFISTHDTYLHSWGSIFIQDVIMPFRKKPFTPEQHIRVLRYSIFGVAVYIYLFSYFFHQTEYIYMFFAITGAIFTGGAGSVIIGGLYWKKGSTAAAWSAMIAGSTLAVIGIIIRQVDTDFPLNGQYMWFISMAVSLTLYVSISLLGKGRDFDMDRMLHRGQYAVLDDEVAVQKKSVRSFSEWIGIGPEFNWRDKIVYHATIIWTVLWIIVFVAGTIYNLLVETSTEGWARFWAAYIVVSLIVGAVVTVWLTIGGFMDVKKLYELLRTRVRDDSDDGMVMSWEKSDETEAVSESAKTDRATLPAEE